MNERAVLVGESGSLFGILTEPSSAPAARPCGGLLLNAGVMHRVGPNRVYVKLARRLAQAGFMVLRFDFSGIGDSPARANDLPFHEYAVAETQEALRYLAESKRLDRFVLIGICSGADIALRTAVVTPDVTGVVLINGACLPPGTEDVYRRAVFCSLLMDPRIWLRFFTGKSDYAGIARYLKTQLAQTLARKGRTQREVNIPDDWRILAHRGVNILMVFSEGDSSLRVFKKVHEPRLRDLGVRERLRVEIVRDADHTFTLLSNQEHLISMIDDWARALDPA